MANDCKPKRENYQILFLQDIQAGVGRSMRSLMAAGSAIGHRMLGMITRAPSETIITTMIIIITILLLLIITIITILLIPMIAQDCSPTPPSCSPRAKCNRSGQRSLPQTNKKIQIQKSIQIQTIKRMLLTMILVRNPCIIIRWSKQRPLQTTIQHPLL